MGQSKPIEAPACNDDIAAAHRAALGWAEIAGLVDIHPDGSWVLTPLGLHRLSESAENGQMTSQATEADADALDEALAWDAATARHQERD